MSDPHRSTLFILRHAHSSWALPGQRDHQRELDDRGRADAPKIGAEISRCDYKIDAVVCSTAVRAAQTLAAIQPNLPADIAVETSDDLYALGVDAYLGKAKAAGPSTLLIIGHNPMIEDFTVTLCGSGEAAALERLKEGFPTAGLAVMEFETMLTDIAPGSGRLVRLVHPADLSA